MKIKRINELKKGLDTGDPCPEAPVAAGLHGAACSG